MLEKKLTANSPVITEQALLLTELSCQFAHCFYLKPRLLVTPPSFNPLPVTLLSSLIVFNPLLFLPRPAPPSPCSSSASRSDDSDSSLSEVLR